MANVFNRPSVGSMLHKLALGDVSVATCPKVLVDIGANLTHPTFNNSELSSVIQRAQECGIKRIMVTGTSVENSKEAVRLCQLFPGYLKFTAGIHPHDAKTFDDNSLRELEELAKSDDCVAIGECGLDFNRNFSTPEQQLFAFESQVKLACKVKKPMFIHERDASESMVKILGDHKNLLPNCVLHCFTGTADEAKAYIDMGFYIGLTGFLWKDRSDNGVRHALKTGILPIERVMVETDAPYMYPNVTNKHVPKEIQAKLSEQSLNFLKKYCNFQRNEPCSLPATVDLIAAFANRPADEVALMTSSNAFEVYGL